MARISWLEKNEAPEEVRQIYGVIEKRTGRPVSNIFKAMAHSPQALRAVFAFYDSVFPAYQLDPKLRMLAQLKVSLLSGCGY